VNKVDKSIQVGIASGGALISYLFGGWDTLIQILIIVVAIDYITGFLGAAVRGELKSKIGLKGISIKIGIFAIIAVAHLIDVALGLDASLFRNAAIFFYLANEILSITENVGSMGVPIPPKIQQAIEIFKEKGGKDETLLPK
jgi:toxin secretion/phage lysis holin